MIVGAGFFSTGRIKLTRRNNEELTLTSTATGESLRKWRLAIGFGFRDKGLLSNLSLFENVDLPARYHSFYAKGEKQGARAKDALTEVGVDASLWRERPTNISWTVRKKVLLARSIVLNPDLLILDDPSSMLPSEDLPWLVSWIKAQAASGKAILCGSNDLSFAASIADWALDKKTQKQTRDLPSVIDQGWLACGEILARKAANL